MKITINDHKKIYNIQEEFNTVFPYLKLEFFSKFNNPEDKSIKNFVKKNNNTLGECRTIQNIGKIAITPTMTVFELEQSFTNIYGLGIQVFRKSGKIWLEATITEDWTLEEQNKQGEDLCKVDE